MNCPKCEARTAPEDRVCQHCGAELAGRYAVSPAALKQTPSDSALEMPYAGFWRRVAAFGVDSLLLGLLGQGLGIVWGERFSQLGQSGRWIGFLIAAIYVIPAHHLWGQTLGKRVLDLRVQRLDGGPLSVAAASARYLALAIPWFLNGLFFTAPHWPWALLIAFGVILGSVLFVGILGNLYLLLFNRPSRRLLHDWVAGTLVVPAEGVKAAPRHIAIVGMIPLLILALLGWIALRVPVTPLQITQLQGAQEALSHVPGVLQGSLVDQQNFTATKGRTHVITARLWIAEPNEGKRRALQRQAVATIFEQYPNSRTSDGIYIVLVSGFDIGIASLWRSEGVVHSAAEWQGMLSGASPP